MLIGRYEIFAVFFEGYTGEFAQTISRVPRLVMAASSILCLGCGKDITETPQERQGLGEGSANIVDGVGVN